MAGSEIASVLYVCGRNAVRSPMAQALTDALFPKKFHTGSAGVLPGEADPFVDVILAEIGIDRGDQQPTALEELPDLSFDLAITLSPEAHHCTLELVRTQAINVEYWPTPDPTLAIGSRMQMLDAYRELREYLATRIKARLGADDGS